MMVVVVLVMVVVMVMMVIVVVMVMVVMVMVVVVFVLVLWTNDYIFVLAKCLLCFLTSSIQDSHNDESLGPLVTEVRCLVQCFVSNTASH